jgi:dihydrofolate synthase / folylpolyglutamate synthase
MTMPQTLEQWLAHCEQLHPKTIDLTLERVRAVAQRLGLRFEAPVITVAGTNGKGSTCAMLESILRQGGYRVGLYTSPHLVDFVERCRIDAQPVTPEALLPHFATVEAARQGQTLTYFEFTTLALLRCLSQADLQAVILEVGLGGRLDAVNVIDPDCAVITAIDIDHAEWLGPDRETIALEKAGIVRSGRPAIVSDPDPAQSLLRRLQAVGADAWLPGRDFQFQVDAEIDAQQWSWQGRGWRIPSLAWPALRGAHQLANAAGVLAALAALRARLPLPVQAVRTGLALVELPGRFQVVPGQPALVLDVAHNPHAAAALARNLDRMGYHPCTHAVLGAMADKDLEGLLRPLLPLVEVWHFCDLPTPRAATAQQLAECLKALRPGPQVRTHLHVDPRSALAAATAAADPADRIVVFGSFFTVGGVLQGGLPRRVAPHLH